jgi:hypothetical protein
MSEDGITVFAPRADGSRLVQIQVGGCKVQVEHESTDHALVTARDILRHEQALNEARVQRDFEKESSARKNELLDAARAREKDRVATIDRLLSRKGPMLFGVVGAREEAGQVWLGDPGDDWRSRYAWRFGSWAELRCAHPELAPVGLRVDKDGMACVLMDTVPVKTEVK